MSVEMLTKLRIDNISILKPSLHQEIILNSYNNNTATNNNNDDSTSDTSSNSNSYSNSNSNKSIDYKYTSKPIHTTILNNNNNNNSNINTNTSKTTTTTNTNHNNELLLSLWKQYTTIMILNYYTFISGIHFILSSSNKPSSTYFSTLLTMNNTNANNDIYSGIPTEQSQNTNNNNNSNNNNITSFTSSTLQFEPCPLDITSELLHIFNLYTTSNASASTTDNNNMDMQPITASSSSSIGMSVVICVI